MKHLYRLVKLIEATDIEEVLKIEKKHKAIKVEECEDDEETLIGEIGFHVGRK